MMGRVAEVSEILTSILGLDSYTLDENTSLLGSIPEFDSMAVVSVLTALEEKYDLYIEDDEVEASIFESVGSLVAFVEGKLG